MRQTLILILTLALTLFATLTLRAGQEIPPSGDELGSVTGGDFQKAQLVIDNKCIPCHSPKRIEEALAADKDLGRIQKRMEQKGVSLTADEETVLGVFWKETPLKARKPLPK